PRRVYGPRHAGVRVAHGRRRRELARLRVVAPRSAARRTGPLTRLVSTANFGQFFRVRGPRAARTIIPPMIARAERVDRGNEPREDHYVHLYGVTWADYLRLLEIRGERSAPRLTYVEGTLEIMSPPRTHD